MFLYLIYHEYYLTTIFVAHNINAMHKMAWIFKIIDNNH